MYVAMKRNCQLNKPGTIEQARNAIAKDKLESTAKGYINYGYWIGEILDDRWIDINAAWQAHETVIKREDGTTVTYTTGAIRKEKPESTGLPF